MVKKTYVPNTIRIWIYEVDLWHHMIKFKGRSSNQHWSPRKKKREEEKKKWEKKRKMKRLIRRRIWRDLFDVANQPRV
jgi:hypothetical protein